MEAAHALQVAAGRLADMAGGLNDTSIAIPGSAWTVGETMAHLVLANRLWTELLRGGVSPFRTLDDFPALNAALIGEFPERQARKLADLLLESTRRFIEEAGAYPDDHRTGFHFGGTVSLTCLACFALNHLLAHAVQVARGLGAPIPIDSREARLAIHGLVPVLPLVFDPTRARGARARVDLRVRGGPRFALHVEGGRLTVEPASGGRFDCRVSADPVAFFLVANGLESQWGPIARGKLVAWGRAPWVALGLKGWLPNP